MTPGGTVDAFLRELARRGVALSADGDALRVRAPKGTLSNGDRDRLRDEKAAILAHLRGDASSDGEPDDAPFPLTDIQEAYLIGRNAELELGRVGCHAYREFEMAGLDLDRLERAWNAVLARHEMLRVVMTEDGRQRILHAVPWYRIDRLDLREAADPERELADRREARSHHVFKPGEWPLFDIRASLLPDCIRLSVGIDLLVADAAALITLFRDWSALYADSDRVLPPLNASFRDHARRRQMPSPVDRAYWEARLGSFPPAPDLPRLPLAGPPRFSRRSLAVAAAEWGELKRRAAAGGLTPSALLMAVYADILAAWSRRARFAVVVTRFAAPAEMQGVVGDFTETVLLEIDSTPARFLDRAKGLQARLLADLDHPTMSGVAVLRALRRQRPDFEPVAAVFTSTVGHPALDPAAPSPLAWLGETVYAITQTPQVAIDHHVMEQEGGLVASFDAVEALFPAGVLDAMMAAYARLVAALAAGEGWDGSVADAQPPLSRAPLLPAAPAALLHEAVARQAALAPERAAVIAPDLTLDHRTLDRAAAHLAAQISERLGSPETARDRLVAITWPKGWRQIVAALAALKAGAAYLPVDPALPAERRHYLIAQGEALVLPDDAPELALRAAREQPPPALPPVDDPRRLAYVIYTSGSTGVPKGVMIEHRAAWATIAEVNRRWSLNADDRVLGLSSLSFDLSVWDIFGPLSVGGALVLPPSEAVRDPAAWASLLCHHRVTVWNSVPALLALLLEHGLPLGHSLRLALLSGDWVPLPLVRQLREIAPAVRLVALGGATEAAIWSNAHEIGDTLDPAWPSIPYGTPLAGQMLHIVNERCEACPDWVTGEIEIAGAGLARGYWHDEALTAARFVMRGGERRYRTGDLGRFRPYGPDSAPTPIEFLGREDFQVKVQGHRIELGEIEAVLARHPDVAQAVATVVPASGSTVLHAFVVPRAEAWERTRLLLERRGLRRLPEVPRLPLPHRPPADSYERRSVRRFLPDAVALAALAPLLHAAVEDRLVVRLLARHVAGLEPGLWGYEPAPGGLRRLADRDVVIPDAGTAQIAAGAAFLILLDAPPGMSRREALLQAGTAGQRLMQSATTAGLGLCPIGVLRLAGAPVLHAFAGGCPAAETAGIDLAGALREHCAAVLPSWMVPRQVHLVAALPLGANGKLDRAALRPPGEPASAQTTGDGDALRQRVGAIVAEILGEPVEPFHNLFDCGATSLHIVRLQRALADELDSPLGVIDLFRLPTVAALAAALAGEVAASPAAAGAARAARRRQLAQARR